VLKTAEKVGPAGCLAGVVVALALVAHSVPVQRLHDVAEEGGCVKLWQISAKKEKIET
jgi:hypothetical protein